jgi:hypothetical protein
MRRWNGGLSGSAFLRSARGEGTGNTSTTPQARSPARWGLGPRGQARQTRSPARSDKPSSGLACIRKLSISRHKGVFRCRLTSLIRLSVSSLDRFAEVRERLTCQHPATTMYAPGHNESKVHSGMISLSEFPKTGKRKSRIPALSLLETEACGWKSRPQVSCLQNP